MTEGKHDQKAPLEQQVIALKAAVEGHAASDKRFLVTTIVASCSVIVAILALLFSGKTGPAGPKGPDGAPVGTVVAWPGTEVPDETWMICDGRPLKSKSYQPLYEVIGTRYGTGNTDPHVDFNLPDYQGLFFRGVGGGPRNPDAAARRSHDWADVRG